MTHIDRICAPYGKLSSCIGEPIVVNTRVVFIRSHHIPKNKHFLKLNNKSLSGPITFLRIFLKLRKQIFVWANHISKSKLVLETYFRNSSLSGLTTIQSMETFGNFFSPHSFTASAWSPMPVLIGCNRPCSPRIQRYLEQPARSSDEFVCKSS